MSEDEDKNIASHHVMLINSIRVKMGKDKMTEEKISTTTEGRKKARKNERDMGETGRLTMGTSPRDLLPQSQTIFFLTATPSDKIPTAGGRR